MNYSKEDRKQASEHRQAAGEKFHVALEARINAEAEERKAALEYADACDAEALILTELQKIKSEN